MDVSFSKGIPREASNLVMMTVESIGFGLAGISTGTLIDTQFTKLSKKYEEHKLWISILQIAVSGLFLAILYFLLSPFFVKHFQITISGMAFPALFYGVQDNVFSTWRNAFMKSSIGM